MNISSKFQKKKKEKNPLQRLYIPEVFWSGKLEKSISLTWVAPGI